MARSPDRLERERTVLQAHLDGRKNAGERNRLGQFATPGRLALEIVQYASQVLPRGAAVRFLDPAIGTGSFYSALLATFPPERIARATGFEADPHYGEPAAALWRETPLELEIADFTRQDPKARYNLVICNPPYVRHHHLNGEEKSRLQKRTRAACGVGIPGLAGLHCHFLGLAHAWLEPGGVGVWLVPGEFMDVNYGQAVKRYLLTRVTLVHIHRFEPADVQFADALVSSAVVCIRNVPPERRAAVTITLGGNLSAPRQKRVVSAEELARERKWSRFPAAGVRRQSQVHVLGDFFRIRRGVATGGNGYFILGEEQIEARGLPRECFRPILPGPRHVPGDEIPSDPSGCPGLDRRLFLLDVRLAEAEVRERYPALGAYLAEGRDRGIADRYLCRHRVPWYAQERRPPAPIVCTYLGRSDRKGGRPFRFILNHSAATVANVYLAMYPTAGLGRAIAADPGLLRSVWFALNRLAPERLLAEGRVYGGGLHKLEPKELANVAVPELAALVPGMVRARGGAALHEESVPARTR